MTTFSVKVAASADDAFSDAGGTSAVLIGTDLFLGEGQLAEPLRRAVGVRFLNVTVPAGSTITAAYLRFAYKTNNTNSVPVRIYGDYVGNASAFITTGNVYTQISPTTASVAVKDPSTKVQDTYGRLADEGSDDISSIITELIAHPSWVSGNSMRFVCRGENGDADYHSSNVHSWNSNASLAPELVIEYTPGDSVSVEGFRTRNDDGSESAATWRYPQDQAQVTIDPLTAFRQRFVLDTVGDYASANFQLEYRRISNSPIFSDNFNDNSIDTAKWDVGAIMGTYDPAVTVVEQSNRLEITPIVSEGVHYNGLIIKNAINFNGLTASVDVVQKAGNMPPGQGYQITALVISLDSNNHYEYSADGDLDFQVMKLIAGVGSTLHIANNYNATTMRYWRFRHDPKTNLLWFEYSSDNITWVPKVSTTPEFSLNAVKVGITAGSWGSASPAGLAIFDDFKIQRTIDTAWKKV